MSNIYQNFINQCWNDHDKKSQEVANNLKEGLHLIDSSEKVASYVSIATHTFGSHLGKWDEGRDLIIRISKLDIFDNNQAVYRALATLSYCMNDEISLNKYLTLSTEEASEVRVYAMAATELTGRGEIEKATCAFNKALSSAPEKMTKENPAARAIAISGNNLASELEEKETRSDNENSLMLKAAISARKYWEIAGGWLEIERAEYRLSMSYLKAGELIKALEHARICESICNDNNADTFESFYAHEALTKINRQICISLKANLSKDDQDYCKIP